MREASITERDIEEFISTKEDSAYAIAELYTYKWLKTKFNRPIFKGGIFDFKLPQVLLNEEGKDIVVEVKYNHVGLSPEQVRELRKLLAKGNVIFYLVTNRKSNKLKEVDSFKTPIGTFYCYKLGLEDFKGYSSSSIKLEDVPSFESLVKAIEKAYDHVNKGRYRLKDLALVSILTFTGCKVKELLALRKKDFNHEGKIVLVPDKGRRVEYREIPVGNPLFWNIINRYLSRIKENERLFDISERQARNIVYKFTLRYLKRKIRPHAFRHAYATYILKRTKDLETARRLLGHEDYRVLKVYLDYTQEDLEDTLESIFRDLEA